MNIVIDKSLRYISKENKLYRQVDGITVVIGILGLIKDNLIISFVVSVLLVFLIVHFISWIIDCKKADKLNVDLKVFQGK